MKKLTPFLFALLVLVVASMFAFNLLGVTVPYFYRTHQEPVREIKQPETTETVEEITEYPSYYNCLDTGKISKTRDQGELGACWAFAANASLESRLLPEEAWDFSEDHMIYNNGFLQDSSLGGDYYIAMAYLTAWKGPVSEEEDPYNDGITNPDATVVKHLQEAQFITEAHADDIKKLVYTYGAVESSIYISVDENQFIDEIYYNPTNYSYCYDGREEPNHEIVIIGWDDTYSRELFNQDVSRDGAFICMNSWGTEFGNNGVFYVSYTDANIGESVVAYTVIEPVDNYDNIYKQDELGWIGRIGFENDTAYCANVFTADNNESLRAVSFYATDKDTSCAIYICKDFGGERDLHSLGEPLAQKYFENAGYYTVNLDNAVELEKGERFAVVARITTPESKHPIAIEMNSNDGRTGEIAIEGKESYISMDGMFWENTQESAACNICLNVFTDNR